jgi:sulfoxide reductase heme-binding subunit YedZ
LGQTGRRRLAWALAVGLTGLLIWLFWRDAHAGNHMWRREKVNVALGLWSTRLLIATLAVTPVSRLLRDPGLKRLRQPLGLWAAAFIALHTVHWLIYAGIWPDHLRVIVRRRYLWIGAISLALLLPLAATSTQAAIRWLKPRRWGALHMLVYPAAILAGLHELWAYTNLKGEPGVHLALLTGLLLWRVPALLAFLARRRPAASHAPAE